jgi:hypothetical protein
MGAAYQRDEPTAERLDRNWQDILQELRVVQTGVQLLAGFLLTLPFSQRFASLDEWQVRLYLAIVCVAALAVGVTLVPVVVHRRLFGEQVKDRVVATGHLLSQIVTGLLALLLTGIVTLVFSATVGWGAALVAGGLAAVAMVLLLVVAPAMVVRTATRDD